jgi:hypothetical protein
LSLFQNKVAALAKTHRGTLKEELKESPTDVDLLKLLRTLNDSIQ